MIYGGLAALSVRTLPTIASDLKVAKLLRAHFLEPFQVTEDLREKILTAHPVPADWTGEQLPAAIAEARGAAMSAMLGELQELGDVPAPLLITAADLPLAMKSAEGNRAGVADIVTSLGPLYLDAPEE